MMRNNDIVLFLSPVITSTNQIKSTFSQIDFNINLLIAEIPLVFSPCKHCELNLYRGLTEDYSQGNSFSVALRNCSEEARERLVYV